MTPSKTALLHAVKVAATIIGSVILSGFGVWFANPANIAAFSSALQHWGVPVSIVNLAIVGVNKFIDEHKKQTAALQSTTIDTHA